MRKWLRILMSNVQGVAAGSSVFTAAPGVFTLSSSLADGIADSLRLYYWFGFNEADAMMNG